VLGDDTRVPTTYANLPKIVKPGDVILVDDGLLAFTVLRCDDTSVYTHVENSGVLGQVKGVNLPGVKVDLPAVTSKDIADIAFGVEQGVDVIAASFIRSADHVNFIRNLPGVKESGIMIIAKIESQEGMDNFDSILEVADGIMVARGDLGVEIPLEKVCGAQKMMIQKCNLVGKPVITATQMLESMTFNPRPTRAEATDVANAVFDGTDCVMLSGETAKGEYFAEACSTMATICLDAEASLAGKAFLEFMESIQVLPIGPVESIASSAVKTSYDIGAKLIIVFTERGASARFVSKYRPESHILCVTANLRTAVQVPLSRGCHPFVTKLFSSNTDAALADAISYAKANHLVAAGDLAVCVDGLTLKILRIS
jgi:pyruvate kinase